MHVLPVSKEIDFKGNARRFDLDCSNHYVFSEVRPEYFSVPPESQGNYFSVYGRNEYALEAIKNTMHPNCTVETVDMKFHPNRLNIVYYADPKEVVNDDIRKKCDFIVHDNEPKYPYPDIISDSYFGASGKLYNKDFETVRDYYYRLEMADRKTLAQYEKNQMGNLSYQELSEKIAYYKDRIAQAQYHQWQAEECRKKHNNASGLLREKIALCGELNMYKKLYENAPKSIEYMNGVLTDLETKKQENGKIIHILKQKLSSLNDCLKINEHLDKKGESENVFKYNKLEKPYLNQSAEKTKKEIDIFRKSKKDLTHEIDLYKKHIAEQEGYLKDLPKTIANLEIKLNEVKGKLIPLFDDLKQFYIRQRIIK